MRTFLIILAASAAFATAACNTVAGAGRDVSSAGDAVSDAAK
jgi:entericidin B